MANKFNTSLFQLSILEKASKALWERIGLIKLYPPQHLIKIAIVDSGFDIHHPYLKKRLSLNQGWNADGNYHTVEESLTLDAYFNQENHLVSAHGTHIAGIIAQIVSPEIEIIPIKVGSADSWVMRPIDKRDITIINNQYRIRVPFYDAFEALMHLNIPVINLSWSLDFRDTSIIQLLIQLAESEKLLVFAAGNEGESLEMNPNTQALVSIAKNPRIANRIILVGASTQYKNKEYMADFSNKSSEAASPYFIWAPGADILSTAPISNIPSGLEFKSGTSMAAAIITAILGQILSQSPNMTIDNAKKILFSTTKPLYNVLKSKEHFQGMGVGLIQAQAALDEALSQSKKNNNSINYLPPGGFA